MIYYKKDSGKSRVAYQDAVKEALCFGWIDGIIKKIDEKKYTQRFTPRRKGSPWSTLNVNFFQELEAQGLTSVAGKQAFEKRVAGITFTKKPNYSWHRKNLMKKGASPGERLIWHQDHQKFCACRPIPKSLRK